MLKNIYFTGKSLGGSLLFFNVFASCVMMFTVVCLLRKQVKLLGYFFVHKLLVQNNFSKSICGVVAALAHAHLA